MGGLGCCDADHTHLVAGMIGFEYGDVDYACDAEFDPRGVGGVEGVRPYFEKVRVRKTIRTNEPIERIEKLKKNVEKRCPVSNLIRDAGVDLRSEEHTSELQSLMRTSYAVFCLKKKKETSQHHHLTENTDTTTT